MCLYGQINYREGIHLLGSNPVSRSILLSINNQELPAFCRSFFVTAPPVAHQIL